MVRTAIPIALARRPPWRPPASDDPVCGCGHGRSVHAGRGICQACSALLLVGRPTPIGGRCWAFLA